MAIVLSWKLSRESYCGAVAEAINGIATAGQATASWRRICGEMKEREARLGGVGTGSEEAATICAPVADRLWTPTNDLFKILMICQHNNANPYYFNDVFTFLLLNCSTLLLARLRKPGPGCRLSACVPPIAHNNLRCFLLKTKNWKVWKKTFEFELFSCSF